MSYGLPPSPKWNNSAGKIAAVILGAALVIMAGLGAKAVLFNDHPADTASTQEYTAGAAGDAPTTQATSAAVGAPAGSGDSSSPTNVAPSSGNPQWDYTQSLMNDPNVTLKDPERLVTMGKSTCRYWDSVYDGWTPQEKYRHSLEYFTMRKVSTADAEAIISAAVQYLCPQNRSKVEGH
ncbi:MAG: DUF732 domain-containing protein [Actinomycetes bacterium]